MTATLLAAAMRPHFGGHGSGGGPPAAALEVGEEWRIDRRTRKRLFPRPRPHPNQFFGHGISVFPLDSTSLKQLNSLALQRIQRPTERPLRIVQILGQFLKLIPLPGLTTAKNAFMISPASCYFFIRQQRLQRFQAN